MSKGFKETEIGRIPNEWDVKVLGSGGIARISSGGTPDRTRLDYYEGTIPWVKSGELNDSTILDTEEHISEVALNNSSAKLFPINTVLVAMYGATVGRTAILKRVCATNQAVCAIQAIDMLTPEYLRQHLAFIRPFLLNQRYGGAQPNISQTIIKNLKIPLPPLPEQNKIAAVLSKLQKAIEIQDNILGSLRDLKKSMMHHLFSYGLKGEKRKKTEIGLIPEGWEVASIGQAFSVTKKPKNIKYSDYSHIPFVPMDFIDFGGVRLSKFEMRPPDKISSGTYFNEGDILIAKITPSFENGKQSILVNIPNHFGVATTEIIPINEFSGKGNKYYLFYYLLKADVRTMIASKMEGSTGRQRVPVDTLMSVRIPLPSLPEQTEIAHILQAIDRKIEINEGKKAGYQDLFKTMLNNLMTGTIRVNELDIDTAEVEAA